MGIYNIPCVHKYLGSSFSLSPDVWMREWFLLLLALACFISFFSKSSNLHFLILTFASILLFLFALYSPLLLSLFFIYLLFFYYYPFSQIISRPFFQLLHCYPLFSLLFCLPTDFLRIRSTDFFFLQHQLFTFVNMYCTCIR